MAKKANAVRANVCMSNMLLAFLLLNDGPGLVGYQGHLLVALASFLGPFLSSFKSKTTVRLNIPSSILE